MKKFDLTIEKYGVGLSVKDGQFYIRSKDHKQAIPANKIRQITLSKSTSITGAAIQLALDSEIDISFVHKDQMPFARIWNSKFGSIATVRRNQLHFSKNRAATQWIKEIISTKIKNQMALVAVLGKHLSPSYTDRLRSKLSSYLLKIEESQLSDALDLAASLRGWEGNASKLYFQCVSICLPERWQFDHRSRRPARDPFNACLNYSYGILYNKIEGMIIRAGLDPHIGIFHTDQYNRPVLVYDIIEQFRHWAEYPVITAFQQHVFLPNHFDHSDRGVTIYGPGKKILIELIMNYYHEKVRVNNQNTKRINVINNTIISFAKEMKQLNISDVKESKI